MSTQPWPRAHDFNAHSESDAEHEDAESRFGPNEPIRPGEAQRRQVLSLVPSPRALATIGGGIAAVLLGGAVGFWLGRRTAPKPLRPVRRTAATFESAVALAPVAMRLLANPLIRTMAIRMVIKQLNKRIAS
jgi:hypothetical protein